MGNLNNANKLAQSNRKCLTWQINDMPNSGDEIDSETNLVSGNFGVLSISQPILSTQSFPIMACKTIKKFVGCVSYTKPIPKKLEKLYKL